MPEAGVKVIRRDTEPSPAELAAWREFWARLLTRVEQAMAAQQRDNPEVGTTTEGPGATIDQAPDEKKRP